MTRTLESCTLILQGNPMRTKQKHPSKHSEAIKISGWHRIQVFNSVVWAPIGLEFSIKPSKWEDSKPSDKQN